MNDQTTSLQQKIDRLAEKVESLEKNNLSLQTEVESLSNWKQGVITRYPLSGWTSSTLELRQVSGDWSLQLRFTSNPTTSEVRTLIQQANSAAHAMSVEDFYAYLQEPDNLKKFSDDLFWLSDERTTKLADWSSSAQIALIMGVPEPLIKHIIGKSIFTLNR